MRIRRPRDSILLGAETLQLHRKLALLDLVVGERLEVRREAELAAHPDEPLRRVVLVPLDRVAVVHRELVVEVVVTLADGDEGSDHVVTRGVLVVEWCLTKVVSEGVNAEG